MTTINDLKQLQQSGQYHHATYRNQGTVWEGLYIYERDTTGFQGYRLWGAFHKDNPDLGAAMEMLRGISVGAYGNG